MQNSFGSKGIPSLRCNIESIAAPGNDLFSLFRFRHITNDAHLFVEHQFIIILLGDGKEQFIIFSAAERTSRGVQLEFESRIPGFFRNGDLVFVKYTTQFTLATDVKDLRTQSV